MTNDIFQRELLRYQAYLKPQLYDTLVMVGEVFSNEMRVEIIEELDKADIKMAKLAAYQKQREGIWAKGIEQLKKIYQKTKATFQNMVKKEEGEDRDQAEEIITNL